MHPNVTWQSIDIFVVSISKTPGFSEADNLNPKASLAENVVKYSTFLFRFLIVFKCKVIFSSVLKLYSSALKYLVYSLSSELKKLT